MDDIDIDINGINIDDIDLNDIHIDDTNINDININDINDIEKDDNQSFSSSAVLSVQLWDYGCISKQTMSVEGKEVSSLYKGSLVNSIEVEENEMDSVCLVENIMLLQLSKQCHYSIEHLKLLYAPVVAWADTDVWTYGHLKHSQIELFSM